MTLITELPKDHTVLVAFLQALQYLHDDERTVLLRIIKDIYKPSPINSAPIEEEYYKNGK